MKKAFSLIVLLGLVVGAVVTGCKPAETKPEAPATTNAAPANP